MSSRETCSGISMLAVFGFPCGCPRHDGVIVLIIMSWFWACNYLQRIEKKCCQMDYCLHSVAAVAVASSPPLQIDHMYFSFPHC